MAEDPTQYTALDHNNVCEKVWQQKFQNVLHTANKYLSTRTKIWNCDSCMF